MPQQRASQLYSLTHRLLLTLRDGSRKDPRIKRLRLQLEGLGATVEMPPRRLKLVIIRLGGPMSRGGDQ